MDSAKIDNMFDALDEVFVAKMNEHNLSFEELDVVIARLREKIFQAKLEAYLLFRADTKTNSMYG